MHPKLGDSDVQVITPAALLAAALLVLTLAACGTRQPMSDEDRALAVQLLGRPSYTPPPAYHPYMIPTNNGRSVSCSTIGGITNCQ